MSNKKLSPQGNTNFAEVKVVLPRVVNGTANDGTNAPHDNSGLSIKNVNPTFLYCCSIGGVLLIVGLIVGVFLCKSKKRSNSQALKITGSHSASLGDLEASMSGSKASMPATLVDQGGSGHVRHSQAISTPGSDVASTSNSMAIRKPTYLAGNSFVVKESRPKACPLHGKKAPGGNKKGSAPKHTVIKVSKAGRSSASSKGGSSAASSGTSAGSSAAQSFVSKGVSSNGTYGNGPPANHPKMPGNQAASKTGRNSAAHRRRR